MNLNILGSAAAQAARAATTNEVLIFSVGNWRIWIVLQSVVVEADGLTMG